ncbi:hypothetical protein HKX48_006642 [Thoreauomyces humboldtii]|nr:hypothetical protein HKX48_006642 [Thoreauomyces humboldtii]
MWFSVNAVLTTIPIGVLGQMYYAQSLASAIGTIIGFSTRSRACDIFGRWEEPQTAICYNAPEYYCDGGGPDFLGAGFHLKQLAVGGSPSGLGVSAVIGVLWRQNGIDLCAQLTGVSWAPLGHLKNIPLYEMPFCNGAVTVLYVFHYDTASVNQYAPKAVVISVTTNDGTSYQSGVGLYNHWDGDQMVANEWYMTSSPTMCPQNYDWRPFRSDRWPVLLGYGTLGRGYRPGA